MQSSGPRGLPMAHLLCLAGIYIFISTLLALGIKACVIMIQLDGMAEAGSAQGILTYLGQGWQQAAIHSSIYHMLVVSLVSRLCPVN